MSFSTECTVRLIQFSQVNAIPCEIVGFSQTQFFLDFHLAWESGLDQQSHLHQIVREMRTKPAALQQHFSVQAHMEMRCRCTPDRLCNSNTTSHISPRATQASTRWVRPPILTSGVQVSKQRLKVGGSTAAVDSTSKGYRFRMLGWNAGGHLSRISILPAPKVQNRDLSRVQRL